MIPALISAAMLFGCLRRWPYGYYTLLRWVVCATGVLIAVMASRSKTPWLLWVFISLAVLFNPLIPFHLSRDIWLVLDVIAAGLILGGMLFVRVTDTDEKRDNHGDEGRGGGIGR